MIQPLPDFLLDTLVWTGVLIAVVLLLRRPVARQFGARYAYALWSLPALRLVLPPLTLPAWANPWPQAALAPTEPAALAQAPTIAAFDQGMLAEPAVALAPVEAGIDWALVFAVLWLAGAGVFLVRRFYLYFVLREQLLAAARPVGEIGDIRLVETATISGPVAFGVLDKVIALPIGFMASHDRQMRDLAIAHEYQHHKGRDLLVNVLVQPLFALHWFNPLGWTGWRALRRDQEAACDARVVAQCDRQARATYAGVIASFARRTDAAPRPALAAAMACPVLGDKSVIQRLRSLSMSEISPRRRLAGQLAMGVALLALPMTATIAYAEIDPPLPPSPPAAPAAPSAPEAPPAPAAPAAPKTVEVEVRTIANGDVPEGKRWSIETERKTDETGKTVITRRIVRPSHGEMSARERSEMERAMDEMQRDLDAELGENSEFAREMERLGDNREMRREMQIVVADRARASADASRAAAEVGRAAAEAGRAAAHAAALAAPKVVVSCKYPDQPVTSASGKDGKVTLFVCKTAGERIRRDALRHAREAVAADRNLSADERAEALRSIDAEIARPDNAS